MQQQSDFESLEPNRPSMNRNTEGHEALGAIPWNYDRAEIIADGVVHSLGVSLGLVAAFALIFLTSGHCVYRKPYSS
jgi:hemolysin III